MKDKVLCRCRQSRPSMYYVLQYVHVPRSSVHVLACIFGIHPFPFSSTHTYRYPHTSPQPSCHQVSPTPSQRRDWTSCCLLPLTTFPPGSILPPPLLHLLCYSLPPCFASFRSRHPPHTPIMYVPHPSPRLAVPAKPPPLRHPRHYVAWGERPTQLLLYSRLYF